MPSTPSVGETSKVAPLQMVVLIGLIVALGFTETMAVNEPPTHKPEMVETV